MLAATGALTSAFELQTFSILRVRASVTEAHNCWKARVAAPPRCASGPCSLGRRRLRRPEIGILSAAMPLVAGGAASAPLLARGCSLDCAFLLVSQIFFPIYVTCSFLMTVVARSPLFIGTGIMNGWQYVFDVFFAALWPLSARPVDAPTRAR